MSMPASATATTGSPFDGEATALESMTESVHSGSFDESSGPILPPPSKMASEEGFALREWRRLNAIRLAEKEKEEKAMLRGIIEEADEFKREFYNKRLILIENRNTSNREKQEQYLANQERFHAEAQNGYWKAIAELIPYEVPTIEKKGKKNIDKQPTITVITGPKPGKPTDMSRMRQVLVKLKHSPPPHMNPKPSAEAEKDAKAEPIPAVTHTSGKAETIIVTSASLKGGSEKGSTSKPL